MIGFFRPNLEDCTKLVKSAAYASMLKHTKKKTKPVEYVSTENSSVQQLHWPNLVVPQYGKLSQMRQPCVKKKTRPIMRILSTTADSIDIDSYYPFEHILTVYTEC